MFVYLHRKNSAVSHILNFRDAASGAGHGDLSACGCISTWRRPHLLKEMRHLQISGYVTLLEKIAVQTITTSIAFILRITIRIKLINYVSIWCWLWIRFDCFWVFVICPAVDNKLLFCSLLYKLKIKRLHSCRNVFEAKRWI